MADGLGLQGAWGLASLQASIRQRQIDRMAAQQRDFENMLQLRRLDQGDQLHRDQLSEAARTHAELAQSRAVDDIRANREFIAPDTFVPPEAPLVGQLKMAGLEGSLKPQQERAPVDVGPLLPGDTGAARKEGYTTLTTPGQKKEAATEADRAAVRAETAARDRETAAYHQGMVTKQPRTPDPQPQILFDNEGKPHAYQFAGGAAREIPLPAGTVGKTSPITSQTRTQRTNAQNVLSHVDEIDQQAAELDKLGLMGPVGGRWGDFMAGRIGAGELAAGDPQKAELLGQFRAEVGLLKSGMAMVHGGARGGGSPAIMARMDALINADKMDLSLFKGATGAFRKWLKTYAGAEPGTTPSAGGDEADLVNRLNARRKPQP